MKRYLVTGKGAFNFAKGDLVELTDSQAEFYKAKIVEVPEVATPKPKRKPRKPKAEVEKPAE